MIWQKINYIHDNPVKAGLVTSAKDYRWSRVGELLKRETDFGELIIELGYSNHWKLTLANQRGQATVKPPFQTCEFEFQRLIIDVRKCLVIGKFSRPGVSWG